MLRLIADILAEFVIYGVRQRRKNKSRGHRKFGHGQLKNMRINIPKEPDYSWQDRAIKEWLHYLAIRFIRKRVKKKTDICKNYVNLFNL